MIRRRLVFHPDIEEVLDGIVARYALLGPALPGRFRSRLLEQVERIELFPESGAILFESYRRALLKRFPYMAVYLVGDDRLETETDQSRPTMSATRLPRSGAFFDADQRLPQTTE